MSRRVFVSRDVIFEEGLPLHMSASVGEEAHIPLFDTLFDIDITPTPLAEAGSTRVPDLPDQTVVNKNPNQPTVNQNPDKTVNHDHNCSTLHSPTDPIGLR